MSDAPKFSRKEIARSIGWLDDSDEIEWDSADYQTADEDGLVKVEGRVNGDPDWLVYATFKLKRYEVVYSPVDDDSWMYDDEDDDDEDDPAPVPDDAVTGTGERGQG